MTDRIARRERVAAAAGGQVADKAVEIAIRQRQRFGIGDRQHEPGAREQVATCAHVDLRMQARDRATARGIGGPHGLSQREQAGRSGERRKEQTIGAERTSRQHERAGQVVDRIEPPGCDDEVIASRARPRCDFVTVKPHGGIVTSDVGCDHGDAARFELRREQAAAGVDHQRVGKAATDRSDPLDQPLGDVRLERVVAACGTIAARVARNGIEYRGAVHAPLVPGRAAPDKPGMRRWLGPIVDFALPPRCPGCGDVVDDDHRFCTACWQRLDLLTGEGCALCHRPLPGPEGSICAPCLEAPPRHDGVRAAVRYGPVARQLALGLKYGRRTGHARTMAAAMARHVGQDGLLVPVPLHRWRLWSRGFNQAQLIATAIALRTGLSVADDVLVRKRPTRSQRGLSRKGRADAVRGAFRTTRKLTGTVWLVDDVYTTGATAGACAAALKRAGAERVIVLVWARVLDED